MAFEVVGALFETAESFLDYMEGLQFGSWRPKYITMHHTAAPTLKNWNDWQKRKPPVTDLQWLKNLGSYYQRERGWNVGPHVFTTPKHVAGILTPMTKRGIHAASFNANSWGIEIVGYFDKNAEKFEGKIRDNAIGALAAMHLALGISPAPYIRGVSGLHFHRDDPLTSKTCPGNAVEKAAVVALIEARMLRMTGGDHAEDLQEVITSNVPKTLHGIVNTPGDTLNVRADATGRSPTVKTLPHGTRVTVEGEKMNGDTKWYDIGTDEWVAARFIKLA